MTVAAWLLAPLIFVVLTAGVALGFERAFRVQLPDAGLVPFGFCAVVVVALFAFWAGLHGTAVTAVVCLLAVAGLASVRTARPSTRLPRAGTGAFFAVYLLYLLPVLATGHWSWTGYNFVNDTAVQMLLTEHLIHSGFANAAFDPATSSTGTEVARIYLSTNYPLGSHSLLAVLDRLVPGELAPLYQPYLALLGATGAMAASGLLKRAGARESFALLGAVLVMAGNLTYQYVLQGNVKEIAVIAALLTTALLGEAVVRSRQLGLAVAVGVCGAAILGIYSAAGAPYLAAFAAVLVAAVVLVKRGEWQWFVRAGIVATLVLAVTALPALLSLATFGRVASGTFATAAAQQADLGQLLRPLEPAQLAGIWLTPDYRMPVVGLRGVITDVLSALVLVAAAIGALHALRRASLGVVFVVAPVLVALAILGTRVSPYANGKLLAIASVGVMLAAWLAIAAAARHRAIAATAAGLICLGVAWSDALAYHGVKLAPTARMEAMQDIGARLAGRGLVLFNEPDEFGKFFLAPAQMNADTEAITPRQVQLRQPQGFGNLYFDLDQQTLAYVEGFPWIVTRRSPDASRPPANFRPTYQNAYYVVWKRLQAPVVVEHLPLQAGSGGIARPTCPDVAALARRAGTHGHLVAAVRAAPVVLDTAGAERSPGWKPHPYLPDTVVTGTPGYARARVEVKRPGVYRAWLQGSFGRTISTWVDGRRVGTAKGVENLGQWHDTGEVRLGSGRHVLEIRRSGGGLAPGDGYAGELGPLLLTPERSERLVSVASTDAARLCRGSYDWVEAVR